MKSDIRSDLSSDRSRSQTASAGAIHNKYQLWHFSIVQQFDFGQDRFALIMATCFKNAVLLQGWD